MNEYKEPRKGKVYIIGAGPGDEGLITLRGIECLRKADVILYDNLASEGLLKYCKEASEKVYAGKKPGDHALTQSRINHLLAEYAIRGKTVARLKGGDPFVFGRGGEEALELAKQKVEFEIIPGVTAGVAALSYAGIPLTHRGFTSTAAFITGHEDPAKKESGINWEKISTGAGTLVFYMGVKSLPHIVLNLKRFGRPPDTPVALIRRGTLKCQETITGTLDNISQKIDEKGFKSQAIIVVGEVVSLRENLRWFDKKPLFGKRIIVTRAKERTPALNKKLKDLGADVIGFPTIEIRPVSGLAYLDKALREIDSFSWIIFTSANGVDIFFERFFELGRNLRALKDVKIAVIGPETAKRLSVFGVEADLMPDRFSSEGMTEAFRSTGVDYTGKRMFLPASEIATDHIPNELEKMGADVVRIPCYRTLTPEYSQERVDAVFGKTPDLVTFTSSSTAFHLVKILKTVKRESYLKAVRGASIGPITTRTARELGISVVVESKVHTVSGLTESILEYSRQGKE